jgi:hypothetical protein
MVPASKAMPTNGMPFAKELTPETQKSINKQRHVQRSGHHQISQYEIYLNAIWRAFDGWRWRATRHHRNSLKTANLTISGTVSHTKFSR